MLPNLLWLQELKSFQLEVRVDPKYHPKIIGRRGAVITKIRKQHDVNIQFPNKGAAEQDLIVITGYEDKAKLAEDDIKQIVQELVSHQQQSVEITEYTIYCQSFV